MTRRERVLTALQHKQPDRTPTDFQAVSEIWDGLYQYFGVSSMVEILDRLDIDCAWIDPEVERHNNPVDADGLMTSWGGSKTRWVRNRFGAHEEIVRYATDGCETIEEIDAALKLPDLKEYDFSKTGQICDSYGDRFLLGGFASSFYYPTLVRNTEDILTDMVLEPGLTHHLIKRCFDWHIDYHERLLKAAGGRIDAMQIADDFATQREIMISVDMFREFFKKPIMEYVALAKSYGAIPYLHCCGSAYHLIDEFISLGIEILDPIQTVAKNMEPAKLKTEFGDRLSFHGGGETQWLLPNGTPEEVAANARMLSDTLGKNGGYILTSCHFLQADIPVENVLAFYRLENR